MSKSKYQAGGRRKKSAAAVPVTPDIKTGTGAPAAVAAAPRVKSPRVSGNLMPFQYPYVKSDLTRISIVTGVILVILVIVIVTLT